MRHVILGNSAAGFSAATQLRQLNKEDEIVIISKETTPIYSKIMLPHYIGDDITKNRLFLKELEFYRENNIELILGKAVRSIDTDNNEIILEDNTTYKYDNLLIGVGSIPFVIPIANLDKIKYYTINCLDDADIIKQTAKAGEQAIIIGTGLTGIEMAFALSKSGMKVSLVEKGDRLMPMLLGETASRIMTGHLQKLGVEIYLDTTVEEVQPSSQESFAILSNNKNIPFDMFIFAAGSRPNIAIVEGSPIEVGMGIRVDEYMRTSVPNIFAAGDVAEPRFSGEDGSVSSYIWPNAMAQGRCAAINMLGNNRPFDSAGFQNIVQLKDILFYSAGLVLPSTSDYTIKSNYDDDLGIYKKIVVRDDIIYGVQMIGNIQGAREVSAHIKKKSRLSDAEMDAYLSI